MQECPIHTPYIELHQLLKLANLFPSGGEAKQAIAAGWIKLNGQLETRKACKIRPGDIVEFQGQQLKVMAQEKPESPQP